MDAISGDTATKAQVNKQQRHIGGIRDARGLAAKLALMQNHPGELEAFLKALRELYTQMQTKDSMLWVGEIGRMVKQHKLGEPDGKTPTANNGI